MTTEQADRTTINCLTSPDEGQLGPPVTRTDVDLLLGISATGFLRTAAKAAGVKPSVAGRQLDRLERRIGAALTTGGPDNLKLTATGAAVLTIGYRFLRTFTEAIRRIAGTPAPRTLRLAAVSAEWEEFVDNVAVSLPALLPALVSARPDECRDLFDRYQVDAIYTWQPLGESNRLSRPAATYPVIDEPLWIGLPAWHRYADRTTVSLADLHADQWIVGPGEAALPALIGACREAGFEPNIRQVAESTSVARGLLWQGKEIGLLSPVSVPPGDGARFVMRTLENGPHRSHVLVTDPTVVPDRLARVLCHALRAGYRKRALRLNPAYAASLGIPSPAPGMMDAADLTAVTTPAQPASADGQIEPEDVIMLRVISESGSLNRAAPRLLISQPALTRRLKHMERRLGTQLLVRGYRGTVLTVTGQRLVDAVTDAEADFHMSMRSLTDRRAPDSPAPLNLAATRNWPVPRLSLGDRPSASSCMALRTVE